MAFSLLLGLLTPSSEAMGDPGDEGPGVAGLARLALRQARGWSPCPPGLSPPPPQAWAGRPSLTQSSCVLVVVRKVGGGRAGPDGVYEALSVGSGGAGGGMEVLFHKACSVSPGSWASGIGLAAFLPHQGPPIHNRRSPTCWDPQPSRSS